MAKIFENNEVSFTTSTGAVIYFDYITAIKNDSIKHGDEIIPGTPEQIEEIRIMKDEFELRKLNTSRTIFKDLLNEEIKNSLKTEFSDIVNKELDKIKREFLDISISATETINAIRLSEKTSKEYTKIQDDVTQELKELKENKYVQRLKELHENSTSDMKSILNEFNKLNSELKKLFDSID